MEKEKQEKCFYKIESANINIENAKTCFAKGEAIDRLCGKIYIGVMQAIEAWLLKNGLEAGAGYESKMFRFLDCAPKDMSSKTSSCLYTCILLDDALSYQEEDIAHLPRPPLLGSDKWKKDVKNCLKTAEKLVSMIEKEVSRSK